MLISIEGNIGSGKSTLVDYLKSLNSYIFVDEPVNEWLAIKDKDGSNALECFYNNQKENAFCFQILAYITRLKKLMENSSNSIFRNPPPPLRGICAKTAVLCSQSTASSD